MHAGCNDSVSSGVGATLHDKDLGADREMHLAPSGALFLFASLSHSRFSGSAENDGIGNSDVDNKRQPVSRRIEPYDSALLCSARSGSQCSAARQRGFLKCRRRSESGEGNGDTREVLPEQKAWCSVAWCRVRVYVCAQDERGRGGHSVLSV